MLSELRVWSLVLITGAIWATLAIASVVSGNTDALSVIVDVLPLILLVAYAFERRGWRAQWLHPRWVATPIVIGTWRGSLTFYGEDPDQAPMSKVVYLVVRQTLTTASVRLLSDESTSEQVAGGVATGESGYPTIAYLYRNKPGIGLRHSISNIQYGGALIEIVGDPATGLNGEYWTDRKTKGSLAFREHAPTIAQTYEEAKKLSYGPPRPLRILE
jgi:SMODS-associating 2TM, beta-strand rich effector domain